MERFPRWYMHGSPIAVKKFRGLQVVLSERSGDRYVPPHYHELPSIATLLKGDHRFEDETGAMRSSRMGSWYYRPASRPQTHRKSPTAIRSALVEFDPIELGIAQLPEVATVLDSPQAITLAERICLEVLRDDASADALLQGYALQLIGLVIRDSRAISTSEIPDWLIMAKEIVSERFASKVTLDGVAKEVSIHPAHLSRAFRAEFGISFSDHLMNVRLTWAKEELATTPKKIAIIAAEAGFSDHAHLTRAFSKSFGVSPGAFRNGLSEAVQ